MGRGEQGATCVYFAGTNKVVTTRSHLNLSDTRGEACRFYSVA